MASVRQTNFAAGELDPLMWGRTDSPLYRAGLRRLRDFFVTRAGNAMTRPGTRYLGLTVTGFGTGGLEPSRLVPFIVSDEDGYVLEFTRQNFQAWRNGVKVGAVQSTPWSAISQGLQDLQFVQSGDVLTICAKFGVWKLTRTSSTTFAFTAFSFSKASPQWVALPTMTKTTLPFLVNTGNLTVATATSPVRKWRWWVSTVLRDNNGRTFESAAYEVVDVLTTAFAAYGGSAAVGPDRPVTLRRATSGTLWAGTNTYEVKGYNWYRGAGDFSGFIGHTTTELDFIDDGTEPDYTLPHPREVNPLSIPGAVDWPLTVGYFENRLVFGGTKYRPNTLLYSATDDYTGWEVPAVVTPNQALEVEMAVRKRERVVGMLEMQRQLIFTDAAVRAMGGGAPLTPTTLFLRVVSEVGSSARVPPLAAGGRALFVRAKGRGIHQVRPNESDGNSFGSIDVTAHSAHFFREDANVGAVDNWRSSRLADTGVADLVTTDVVDWCYQEDPWNLLWMVRGDGRLISMQLDDGMGCSLHTTGPTIPDSDSDRFESVCSVPEAGEDVVYLCVRRGFTYTIERFASRVRRNVVTDDCAVDCAVAFTKAPGSPLIDVATVLEGRDVWVVAKGNAPVGPIQVASGKVDLAAAGFRLPDANNGSNVTGWVGLLYQPELTTLDASPDARLSQKTVEKVGIEVAESAGFSVGQNPDKLVRWLQRNAASGYVIPSAASAVVDVPVKGGWDEGARVTLRQTLPLPLTVLGITRKVDVGG